MTSNYPRVAAPMTDQEAIDIMETDDTLQNIAIVMFDYTEASKYLDSLGYDDRDSGMARRIKDMRADIMETTSKGSGDGKVNEEDRAN